MTPTDSQILIAIMGLTDTEIRQLAFALIADMIRAEGEVGAKVRLAALLRDELGLDVPIDHSRQFRIRRPDQRDR